MSVQGTLAEQIDGALYVRTDPDADLFYAYHGGHGIHLYDLSGRELDYFQIEGGDLINAPFEDIKEAMDERVER